MASKCFCDACGAEMPATGSRLIEVRVEVRDTKIPFRLDARFPDFDVCERCICKAFADKIGAVVIHMDVSTGPRPPARSTENFVAEPYVFPGDEQMGHAWQKANDALRYQGLPTIDGRMFRVLAGAFPFGVPSAGEGRIKVVARDATKKMTDAGAHFISSLNRTVGNEEYLRGMFAAMFAAMYDAA